MVRFSVDRSDRSVDRVSLEPAGAVGASDTSGSPFTQVLAKVDFPHHSTGHLGIQFQIQAREEAYHKENDLILFKIIDLT